MAGTFARLPGHNLNIPQVHPVQPPARPVIPTMEFARMISEALGNIGHEFSPLVRAQKAAELARARYLQKLYQSGNVAAVKDPLLAYKKALYEARIRHEYASTNHLTMGKPGQPGSGDPTFPFRAYTMPHKAASEVEEGTGSSAIRIDRARPNVWTPPANPFEGLPMNQPQSQLPVMPPESFNPPPDATGDLGEQTNEFGDLTENVFT